MQADRLLNANDVCFAHRTSNARPYVDDRTLAAHSSLLTLNSSCVCPPHPVDEVARERKAQLALQGQGGLVALNDLGKGQAALFQLVVDERAVERLGVAAPAVFGKHVQKAHRTLAVQADVAHKGPVQIAAEEIRPVKILPQLVAAAQIVAVPEPREILRVRVPDHQLGRDRKQRLLLKYKVCLWV